MSSPSDCPIAANGSRRKETWSLNACDTNAARQKVSDRSRDICASRPEKPVSLRRESHWSRLMSGVSVRPSSTPRHQPGRGPKRNPLPDNKEPSLVPSPTTRYPPGLRSLRRLRIVSANLAVAWITNDATITSYVPSLMPYSAGLASMSNTLKAILSSQGARASVMLSKKPDDMSVKVYVSKLRPILGRMSFVAPPVPPPTSRMLRCGLRSVICFIAWLSQLEDCRMPNPLE